MLIWFSFFVILFESKEFQENSPDPVASCVIPLKTKHESTKVLKLLNFDRLHFNDIDWVVITNMTCVFWNMVWVFPSLLNRKQFLLLQGLPLKLQGYWKSSVIAKQYRSLVLYELKCFFVQHFIFRFSNVFLFVLS